MSEQPHGGTTGRWLKRITQSMTGEPRDLADLISAFRERGLTPFHRLGVGPVRMYLLQPTTLDDLVRQLDDVLEPSPALA